MTKNFKYILLFGICLFCLAWYMCSGVWQENEVPDYQRELLRMEQENDSLERMNQALDSVNQKLELETDSLMELLEDDRRIMSGLKRRKSEKIEVIDSYDGGELLQFFAELKTDSTKAE